MGADDTAAAIEQAASAFGELVAMGARERARRLRAFHDAVMRTQSALASVIVAESGKPIVEAMAEVRYAADIVLFYAEEAPRAFGRTCPQLGGPSSRMTVMRPIGVAPAITPWNFPAAMVTRKVAPALAAGCPVVLKPSELTPLTALELHKLASEAGLAEPYFHVVTSTDAATIGGCSRRTPASPS